MTVKPILLLFAASLLQACSFGSGLIDTKPNSGMQNQVQVGNNLAMPPDLQLPPPGQPTAATYQPSVPQAPANAVAAAPKAGAGAGLYGYTAPTSTRAQDLYASYGISTLNPNGTQKNRDQLKQELKRAVIAKKRQTNPNYGSIANVGNIFKDQ